MLFVLYVHRVAANCSKNIRVANCSKNIRVAKTSVHTGPTTRTINALQGASNVLLASAVLGEPAEFLQKPQCLS